MKSKPFPPPLRPLAGLICAALALPCAAAADAVPAEPHAMPTIVVTAASIEQSLRDAPASISVITRADLDKRPVQDLAELLGTIEGVTLTRNGNLVPGVQLRGLGQAYTLFLVDGKRVNSNHVSFRGNDFDTGWVPTAEIERIEVVRGPMSSLYGSDAIGGVVNIITRRIGKAWRGSAKIDAIAQRNAEAGDSRAVSLAASGPLIADVLGLRVSAGYDRREPDGAVNAPLNGVAQPGMPLLANRQLGAGLSWTPAAGHEVKLDHADSRRDHGGFVLERQASSLSHRGRYDFGQSELTLNLDQTRNLVGTVGGQVNPNQANSNSLDGKLILPWLAARQIVTVGADARREKLRDPANITGLPGTPGYRKDPTAAVSQSALFVEDEFTLREDLKLTAGNRYDHHQNFGGHHSPRAYLVYNLSPEIVLKGGWARAFRAPTLLQGSPNWGSVSCGSPTVGCFIIGNPALKPETSTSKELGAQFDYGRFGGGVTLFHNDLKDMITIDNRSANAALAATLPNFAGYLPDGRPIFAYENISKVRTRGVETSARAELSPRWSLRANFTYTDAKNASGKTDLPLVYRPRQSANLALDWRVRDQWTVSASARHIGQQYLSVPANCLNMVSKAAYDVLDLSTAYRAGKNVTVSAGLLNLADKGNERARSTDFNEEGRRLFASVLTQF